MKRYWLLFSQAVTVVLAVWFVLVTLKPDWVQRGSAFRGASIIEATPSGGSMVVGSFSAAAKKAAPAVVSINISRKSPHNGSQNDPWFRFFNGEEDDSNQAGLGSGVIVSADGIILTNNHVVAGADEIEVTLNDGRHTMAKVIGTDPDTDLAVLKISLNQLPVIVWGNSNTLQVGDQVLAIGNPFGVGQTVTSGIISALGRNQLGINTFENFIQTDAAINPGNSGGALVDTQGNFLGINTAIFSKSGGSMGIGFAIPVSTAKQVMEGIVRDGQVTRGWIGVEPAELTPELAQTFGVKQTQGVVVAGVLQNAPAHKAGVRPGDVLLKVDNKDVSTVGELLSRVAELKPGQVTTFKLQRKDDTVDINIIPAQRPKVRPSKR